MFIPVGGKETLEPSQASLLINQIDPRIVFPMHYKTDTLGEGPLCEHPLSAFTEKMSNVDDAATTAVEVELARLPAQTKVVCLRHGSHSRLAIGTHTGEQVLTDLSWIRCY